MRYLLISILSFYFFGCASYTKKNNLIEFSEQTKIISNPYFSNFEKDYVYKAQIEVLKKNLGGIFIVKKLNDNNHRVAFTTEMGAKIFDFSFQGNEFKVNYILEEMNNKILLNILRRDFGTLINEQFKIETAYKSSNELVYKSKYRNKKHFLYYKNQLLDKIIRVGSGKEKVGFYFSGINGNIAKNIKIVHQNFNLKISLRSLK